MGSRLKLAGLALSLCCMYSGLVIPAAGAAAGNFHWTASTTKLTAKQDDEEGKNTETGLQVLGTTSGSVECDEASGEASVTGTEASEVTIQGLKYNNTGKETCAGPFSTSPKVEFNGCDYRFAAGEVIGETGMETKGPTTIECPEGKQITVTAPFCQIHIPAQTPEGHVVYHTITPAEGKHYVTAEATLTGIKYQGTELCSGGTGGQYKGNFVLKGYKQTPHEAAQQTGVEVREPSSGNFHWTASTTKLTAKQDDEEGKNTETGLQVLGTTSGSVECDEASGEASVTGTEASEVTIQGLKYNNTGKETCAGPFSTSPKVEFNGCDYRFAAGEVIGETGMETKGPTTIECPEGKQITVTAPFCQIHIPAQTPEGHVVYHTITPAEGKHYVTAEATLTGIKYQGTELCSGGTGGQYKGNFVLKGYKQTPHEAAQQTGVEVP